MTNFTSYNKHIEICSTVYTYTVDYLLVICHFFCILSKNCFIHVINILRSHCLCDSLWMHLIKSMFEHGEMAVLMSISDKTTHMRGHMYRLHVCPLAMSTRTICCNKHKRSPQTFTDRRAAIFTHFYPVTLFLFLHPWKPPHLPSPQSCSPDWHPLYITGEESGASGWARPQACWLSLSITLSQPLLSSCALNSCHSITSNLRQTAKCMPVCAPWKHMHNLSSCISGLRNALNMQHNRM